VLATVKAYAPKYSDQAFNYFAEKHEQEGEVHKGKNDKNAIGNPTSWSRVN
jgi:hypothetical protein